MGPIVVVGSGASGVHFTLTLLKKGYRVRMLDVGRVGAAATLPNAGFDELKSTMEDPAAFFLAGNLRMLCFATTKTDTTCAGRG